MTCPEEKNVIVTKTFNSPIYCSIYINLFPIAHNQESGTIYNTIQIAFKACSQKPGFIDFASLLFLL